MIKTGKIETVVRKKNDKSFPYSLIQILTNSCQNLLEFANTKDKLSFRTWCFLVRSVFKGPKVKLNHDCHLKNCFYLR